MAESKSKTSGTSKRSSGSGKSSSASTRGSSQRSAAPKKPTKEELAKEAERLKERKKLHDEVFAVIYIAVGLFLVISLLTNTTGVLGGAIQNFMFGLFGNVAYVLAVFFIVYGILIFAKKTSFMTARSVIFVILMFLLITSLTSVRYVSAEDFALKLGEIYKQGTDGPGVVGALVGRLIFNLIGKTGLYIFSIAGILISLLFIIQTPVSELFDNMRVKRQAARALREEEEEKIREYEEQMSIEDVKPAPQKPAAKPAAKPQVTDLEDVDRPINIVKPAAPAANEPKLNLDSIKAMHGELPQAANAPALDAPEEAVPVLPSYDDPVIPRRDAEAAAAEAEAAAKALAEQEAEQKKAKAPAPDFSAYADNQKKILDYVADDDLFKKKEGSTGLGLDGHSPQGASQEDMIQDFRLDDIMPSKKKEPAPQIDMFETAAAAPTPAPAEDLTPASAPASAAAAQPAPGSYKFPPIDLLKKPAAAKATGDGSELQDNARLLEDTLASFKVHATVADVVRGPAVTRYEVIPATGVKVRSIENLQSDIALNLRAKSIRIEAPIPGKAAVGIEVSNDSISTVMLREILESQDFKKAKSKISVGLGRSISGAPVIADLKKMPHLLIAGATGSGKSVCINSIIMSILYKAKPDEVKLILIDPKVVELSNYNGIPHLMIPVVTDPPKASAALGWAVSEMNERYNKFADVGVRDLESYNEYVTTNGEPEKFMPQVVIIIDELADLIMAAKNQVEDSICRLAQKARAAGMHLIIATQRPSVDVITGVIKANVPSRIAFAVASQIDSRTILDMPGAENLLGKGDMLYYPQDISKPIRLQGCFVSDHEVNDVIDFVKKNSGETRNDYASDIEQAMKNAGSGSGSGGGADDLEDDLLVDAIECVVNAEQCSVSMLQRRFRIGYNRSARLVDLMEERGIVGPADGSRPRKVLMTKAQFAQLENELNGDDGGVPEEIM